MGLKDVAASLPPGFRFHPSDQELLSHYLYQKITSDRLSKGTLVEVDLHKCEPWQLPDVAKFGENEWYFFNFRDRKYATGFRINRATTCGYWKATGKDRPIFDPSTGLLIGMRKTLVFYHERAPNGIKTGWVMHEFRLEGPHTPPKEDWVLCRVFEKSKCEAPSSKFSSGWSSNQGLEASPPNVDQTIMPPSSTFPHQDLPNCNTLLNSPILHFCSYGFPSTQLGDTPPFITDHEYDFLLDMGLENHNVEGLQI